MTSSLHSSARPGALRRSSLTLLVTGLLTILPLFAHAQGGSVRYSYEKVEVAGTAQWVLVPRAELDLALKGKAATKGNAIEAFTLLKKKKKTSYGNAKIQIGSGSWPSKAKISVTIDPKYATYAPIVMAEVVYTLTEMGLPGVDFPGYSQGALGREDIRFPVYTLTMPMWQALPPDDISVAQVTMADGTTLHISELYSRWKKKDKSLYKEIYAFLGSGNVSTTIFVLRKLPTLKIPYVDQTLPLLAHSSASVRREALVTLESKRNEGKVSKAVAKQLTAEKDEPTALAMAAFLGGSKDKAYAVLEPLWLLENATDEKASVKAASALVAFKSDSRVLPALYAQLSGKRKLVASASMDAIASADDDASQIKALSDSKIPTVLRNKIAASLSSDKDEKARVEGYAYLARNGSEREATRAIEKLAAEKSASSRERAEGFLSDKAGWRRAAAAVALGARKDSASIPAFSKAIKSYGDDRELERAGYTIMLAQPLKSIQEQTKSKNSVTQRLAYLAMGERAKKEGAGKSVFETLKAGTQSKDAMVRGASARALGAFADKKSADVLGTLRKDKSDDVRRDVAVALGEFKGGELIEVLLGYMEDSSPQVVAASIDSLGLRAEGSAWDSIRSEVNSKHPEVRASALRGLARLVNRSDRVAVTEVISVLSGAVNDKNVMIRKRALEQLGTFKDENAVLAISSQLGGDDLGVRVAALRALGTTQHPSATELIVDQLDDPEFEIRYAATEAIADHGDKSARKGLEAQSKKEADAELKSLMNKTLKKL